VLFTGCVAKLLTMRMLEVPALFARFTFGLVTYHVRPLPEVLLIGAQKSGTTSLYNYLVQHPAVLPALRKGAHFFDFHHRRGTPWYRANFPTRWQRSRAHRVSGCSAITLEASPYYLYHPLAPARAHGTVPGAKLIAVLRNPIDRAYSHYHHERRAGREQLPLRDAFAREAERLAGEEDRLLRDPGYYSFPHQRYSYLARGRYAEQLRRWLEYYPSDQLCVIASEELFEHPADTMERIYGFLGLPEHALPVYETYGPRGGYSEMDQELRTELSLYFAPYNQELYDLIGRDLAWTV
jgi:hypothetical protein